MLYRNIVGKRRIVVRIVMERRVIVIVNKVRIEEN